MFKPSEKIDYAIVEQENERFCGHRIGSGESAHIEDSWERKHQAWGQQIAQANHDFSAREFDINTHAGRLAKIDQVLAVEAAHGFEFTSHRATSQIIDAASVPPGMRTFDPFNNTADLESLSKNLVITTPGEKFEGSNYGYLTHRLGIGRGNLSTAKNFLNTDKLERVRTGKALDKGDYEYARKVIQAQHDGQPLF